MKLDYTIIKEKEYYELLEDWFNGKNIGRERYILKENGLYIGVDNTTNDFWTEEFESLEKAKKYIGVTS